MKRTAMWVLVLSLALLLLGCGKTSPGLSGGTYSAGVGLTAPSVTFDLEENRFVFSYDLLSSYLNAGTFWMDSERVTAVTDDEKYTFVFEIQDNETVAFVREGSAEIQMTQGAPAVADGTVFHLLRD